MKLSAHPGAPASTAIAVAAAVERAGDALLFSYSLCAPADAVRLPAAAEPGRADELWKTTCFEAFIRGAGESYVELNFSPSGKWAVYVFDGYRQGMRKLEMPLSPDVQTDSEPGQLTLTARVRLPDQFMRATAPNGLSAVIEELDGTMSYWALAHPDGPPDFHHPDCFAAKLP
jgi:hypothetical protein